jgi:mannosyltransferase OCH1-like enzyme
VRAQLTISKIIHHIAPANKSQWHPIWDKCYPTWQKHFPEFEHKMWNDENDIDDFVRETYPQYWQLYCDFPVHIMRIDFVRFCLLHHFGGIYSDMDMFCYKNFYDELDTPLHIVEAPYGEEFLESSLMISEPNCEFWIDCMELSKKQFYNQVQKRNIKIPFNNDYATQYIIQSATGPNLICRVWRKWAKTNKIKTLPGVLYNNHGMSYHLEYRTKHMMTGMWGKESVKFIEENADTNDLKKALGNGYINEMKNYVQLNNVTIDTFDFYHDYTNGGMKTHFIIDLERSDVDNASQLKYG